MRIVKGFLVAGITMAIITGCGANSEEEANNSGVAASSSVTEEQTDAVTTASIVNEAEAFIKAIGEDGSWIIATLGDMTMDKDMVVSGQFHDKGDTAKDIYRKIALYTQDADHNITASFSLTVPAMKVKSENLRVQGGTIKGDVYVEANGFHLHESASIEGNLYYANADVQASAKIDGKVSGETAVK